MEKVNTYKNGIFFGIIRPQPYNQWNYNNQRWNWNIWTAVEELTDFENDLMLMIKNVQFRNINSTFQEQLRKDIQEIQQSNQLFVSGDKSRNIYKTNKEDYVKLMYKNITKTYKKTNESKIKTINKSA